MSDFNAIQALVAEEQTACNELIRKSLHSPIELINQIGGHIIDSGGKRLRPLLVLLSAKAFGCQGSQHIQLAAIIELLHTATLLHDDVVDHSQLRRGKPTANQVWGDHASVLVGDYLYSRAFELIVNVNNMHAMEILAKASNQMAEGEVLQLLNCRKADISEQDYMRVIDCKTGALFSAAAQMGAILSGQSESLKDVMRRFGVYLGAAFQLVDDALDYHSSSEQTGKNAGNDIAEGKPTLPFIYALEYFQQNHAEKAEILRTALTSNKIENLSEIRHLIQSSHALSKTYKLAQQQAFQAKNCLSDIPASPYRDGLSALVNFAAARRH